MAIIDVPSPNYKSGRSGYSPIGIVVHIMDGSLAGTDSWFQNRESKVSAHYGVGKNGEVHRYVAEENTAWHAGRVAAPTWSLLKPAADSKYINPNLYTIGIEHEGHEDTEWSDAMYSASALLIKDICNRWGIAANRLHIIGHREIYAVKTCPGQKVNFQKLIALVNNTETVEIGTVKTAEPGIATTIAKLNLRLDPSRSRLPSATVPPHISLAYEGYTNDGENIEGNSKWLYTREGLWFWSGGVRLG
jgi:N-acetyl-anhydromuramyl-L-alanine amidase AmpD